MTTKFSRGILIVAFAILTIPSTAQQEITRSLKSFSRIVASPRINLILQQGEEETIRIVYSGVEEAKINIELTGNTLCIYLDGSKVVEKMERIGRSSRRSIYTNANVTAYVTYRDLEHLEIRGKQELTCNGAIRSKKFTLKAYGENEITLASLKTEYLKTSLYGENKLKIKGGKADF